MALARVPAMVMFVLSIVLCSVAANASGAAHAEVPVNLPASAVATGSHDDNGQPIYAFPAIVVTDRDGKQTAYPILDEALADGASNVHPTPEPTATPEPKAPQPSSWYKTVSGPMILPSLSISTSDWISATATIVFGTFQQRAADQNARWALQENRITGLSLTGELGHNTRKLGIGMSHFNFVTFLFIIPVPAAVSWSAHAVLLHADKDTRGFGSGGGYAGADGSLSLLGLRFSGGLYRQLARPASGKGLSLRLGVGIGL